MFDIDDFRAVNDESAATRPATMCCGAVASVLAESSGWSTPSGATAATNSCSSPRARPARWSPSGSSTGSRRWRRVGGRPITVSAGRRPFPGGRRRCGDPARGRDRRVGSRSSRRPRHGRVGGRAGGIADRAEQFSAGPPPASACGGRHAPRDDRQARRRRARAGLERDRDDDAGAVGALVAASEPVPLFRP